MDRQYQQGDGVIELLGDIRLADGRVLRGAIVTFPAGPPSIPIGAVCDRTPVILMLKPAPDSWLQQALRKVHGEDACPTEGIGR